jgi:hypothetical protein
MNDKIKAYDVRVGVRQGGRATLRVAAVNAAEARAQIAWQGYDEIISVGRSQYAIGRSHRETRREFVKAAS